MYIDIDAGWILGLFALNFVNLALYIAVLFQKNSSKPDKQK